MSETKDGVCGYCGREVYEINGSTYNHDSGGTSHDCADELKAERDRWKAMHKAASDKLAIADLQIEDIKKNLVVGGMPVPGLICVAEAPFVKSLQEFRDLELKYDECFKAGQELNRRITGALNELGVPQPGYPAPVANAVDILTNGLKRKDQAQVCDSCGWNNGPEGGGGSRVMYSVGKVVTCEHCIPTSR